MRVPHGTGHETCHHGQMENRRLAAFDFDGTLTRRDTLVPFLISACGAGSVMGAAAMTAPRTVRARFSGSSEPIHPRDAAKEAVLHRLLAGRGADWLSDRGRVFSTTLSARLRPETVDQLRWHQDHGDLIAIVSASLLAYLQPFGAEHGIDHVIAVEMDTGPGGVLTGRLAGPNVRGPEKRVRLQRWLDDNPQITEVWAYGNSSGDTDLLAMADRSFMIDGQHHEALIASRHQSDTPSASPSATA